MINPSLYEEYFMKGIEVLTEDFGSELVKKQVERFYLNTFVDDEKDALKNSIASFQKKDWHELKENIHVLKGRFLYAVFCSIFK